MKIKLAGPISTDSIVDGPGLRTVVWCQGCSWHCPGCHNKETQDPSGGEYKDVQELLSEILNVDMQSGVTLSGGDPLFQPDACIELAKGLKKYNKNIWCYTGFLYEDILKDEKRRELLQYIDVLVDGPFVENLKTYNNKFRGSSNQRLIDVQKSLLLNEIILFE